MEQVQQPLEAQIPSFSIVLETENLVNADLAGLSQSLTSLVQQDLSPTRANEVILIDSGDTPPELLEQLCKQYPWIKVHPAPEGIGYYQVKMMGAGLATGEIVVYCDADCIYEPQWLRSILTSFTQQVDVQVVAGETMTRGEGIYGTAMALTYIFPQYSGQKGLTPTSQYFLNNVAFRRDFLLKHPIPDKLPLYRGNCVIHAQNLIQQGYTIWKQPEARANHAPPSDLSHFFWRFLLIGHDYYWQKRIASEAKNSSGIEANSRLKTNNKFQVLAERLQGMLANNPRHLIYLPLAIPVVMIAAILIVVGYIITVFKSNYLLHTYNRILGEVPI